MSAFVTSDLHLGHAKSLTFLTPSGERMRPFDSVEHMHDVLRTQWNNVVKAGDTVYVLGDVAMRRQALHLLEQFKGRKVLIKGNHDIYKLRDYVPYFDDIRGVMVKDGLVFTHIPIHRDSFEGRYIGNVHGHLHCHLVKHENGLIDTKYLNACVEHHNFAPVPWEVIRQFAAEQKASCEC